jgi:hypothetical protein
MMTERWKMCPGWLDDAAKAEWRRRIDSGDIGPGDHEALAVYAFVISLRQRVCDVEKNLLAAEGAAYSSPDRQGLLRVLTDLDERLAFDLWGLSVALGIDDGGGSPRRPTTILVLDEGADDTPTDRR